MATLADIIKKRKRKKALEEDPNLLVLEKIEDLESSQEKNLFRLINQSAKEIIDKLWVSLKSKLISDTNNIITEKVNNLTKNVKKGDTGDEGERGEKGDSIKGDKGDSGRDGKEITGIEGLQGEKGNQGDKGDSGIDGSSDKPLEIANKLNTLEEKIERKTIKGLEDRLRGLEKLIQDTKRIAKSGGGGGMGNPLHETFNLSSATTSVTLTSNVAAAGFAIWIYYQGQNVSRNDAAGYSISGKEITLNFTPVDSTFLDIIYMRA